jgi:hypothetical protein
MKGYKITNSGRTKKYGVVADTFRKLKEKAEIKFSVSIYTRSPVPTL